MKEDAALLALVAVERARQIHERFGIRLITRTPHCDDFALAVVRAPWSLSVVSVKRSRDLAADAYSHVNVRDGLRDACAALPAVWVLA
jgi:hypothetical protein